MLCDVQGCVCLLFLPVLIFLLYAVGLRFLSDLFSDCFLLFCVVGRFD